MCIDAAPGETSRSLGQVAPAAGKRHHNENQNSGMDSDYYRVLGVRRAASQADIRNAYRRLAMRWHPDRNPDTAERAEAVFKSLQQAYAVLKDPGARAAYDAQMAQPRRNDGPPAPPDTAHNPGTPGADYVCETTIPLETAVLGGIALTRVSESPACVHCSGKGQQTSNCATCEGRGSLARRFRQVPCTDCKGAGQRTRRCDACRGLGTTRVAKLLRVTVPAHTRDGTVLRARGLGGESVDGGPRGNLLCKVSIRADRVFRMDGLDLQRELKIDFVVAILGGQVPLMRFRNSLVVEVPPMTRSGALIRIAGQGLQDPKRRRSGDLVLKVMIDLPAKMRMPDERQRAVLREIARGY
ncbi:DnaJ C-terminal domain-containing protein [Cupriavidus pinatubonensis]|nr:J domain-containing protein [Cupriavidus pinatubonensis]